MSNNYLNELNNISSNILDLEAKIETLRSKFNKFASTFLEIFEDKVSSLLEEFKNQFNLDISFELDFFLHGLNYYNFQNWKKEITYKIIWRGKTYLFNHDIGWFWSDQYEFEFTKFNINRSNFPFSNEDLENLIIQISNCFNNNLTISPQIGDLEYEFVSLHNFKDVQLFLNEEVELLYEDKIFYSYDDEDDGNFYFVKNSKGEIQIFVSEQSSFALENLGSFHVLKGNLTGLDIFFSNIWREGDNFEFEHLGKQWKKRILESWN